MTVDKLGTMVHARHRRPALARLVAVTALVAALSACASSGMVYTPQPFPKAGSPAPAAVVSAPAPTDAGGTTIAAAPAVPPGVAGRGTPTTAGHAAADGYALSGTALSLRGAPYRDGGVDPNGFDCSGFVRYVYAQHGVAVPRQVKQQFQIGKKVDRDRLEPGDLVFFTTVAPGASHVGIMIGGDQFVHAPSERGVVRVESLGAQYWSSRYIGAKRVSS